MIRPSNIDVENHTADFYCDQHNAYELALNLNTVAVFVQDEQMNNVAIKVSGSMLTQGNDTCNHNTFFPLANGNQDAQLLAQAKTE